MITRCQSVQLEEGLKEHLKKHGSKYLKAAGAATALGAVTAGVLHGNIAQQHEKDAESHEEKMQQHIKKYGDAQHDYGVAKGASATHSDTANAHEKYNTGVLSKGKEFAKVHRDSADEMDNKKLLHKAKSDEHEKKIKFHEKSADNSEEKAAHHKSQQLKLHGTAAASGAGVLVGSIKRKQKQ